MQTLEQPKIETEPAHDELLCEDVLARCVCREPMGHDGPHACNGPSDTALGGKCKGKWEYAEDGVVHIVAFPMFGMSTLAEEMDLLLGGPGD